jgi:hypothetical protein
MLGHGQGNLDRDAILLLAGRVGIGDGKHGGTERNSVGKKREVGRELVATAGQISLGGAEKVGFLG